MLNLSYRFGFLVGMFYLGMLLSNADAQAIAITPAGDTVYLHNDGSYQKKARPQKEDVRLKSNIKSLGKKYSASNRELEESFSLAVQGWRYTLPQPKSSQAAWGNNDGRTTWWYGYWKNSLTGKHSSTKPSLSKAGVWIGNDQNMAGYYRRGGSPAYPNKVELILSEL